MVRKINWSSDFSVQNRFFQAVEILGNCDDLLDGVKKTHMVLSCISPEEFYEEDVILDLKFLREIWRKIFNNEDVDRNELFRANQIIIKTYAHIVEERAKHT